MIELIKQLRQEVGAKMSDCQEALKETNGDLEAAKEWLRKKGIESGAKKGHRPTGEGAIVLKTEKGEGVLLELNCETDFVARSDDFQALATQLVDKILADSISEIDSLLSSSCDNLSVKDAILATSGKVGENVALKRFEKVSLSPGVVASYVHAAFGPQMGKIGVLLGLESGGAEEDLLALGRKICMHIAASSPRFLRTEDIDAELIESETVVLKEQLSAEKKPENVMQKIIEGRLQKFCEQLALEEQPFIMNPDQKVKEVVQEVATKIGHPIRLAFMRVFVLGKE
jgi:elongation factor Ts